MMGVAVPQDTFFSNTWLHIIPINRILWLFKSFKSWLAVCTKSDSFVIIFNFVLHYSILAPWKLLPASPAPNTRFLNGFHTASLASNLLCSRGITLNFGTSFLHCWNSKQASAWPVYSSAFGVLILWLFCYMGYLLTFLLQKIVLFRVFSYFSSDFITSFFGVSFPQYINVETGPKLLSLVQSTFHFRDYVGSLNGYVCYYQCS